MNKYVLFLRGINVGGKTMRMQELQKVLQELAYSNVKTILASGNAIFTATEKNATELESEIEAAIEQHFHYKVTVQVRPLAELQSIIDKNPFAAYQPDKQTHWYVTFLTKTVTQLPPEPAGAGFKFLGLEGSALFSTLDRANAKSVDFMTYLDKQFGKAVTTRNWNTLLKVIQASN